MQGSVISQLMGLTVWHRLKFDIGFRIHVNPLWVTLTAPKKGMFNATFVQFHHEKTSIFSAVPTSISGGYWLPRQRQTDFCFSRTCTASLIFCFSFLGPSWRGGGWISPCFTQHRTSKLEVTSPQNMAKNMVLKYLHFRILKFPLTGEDLYLCYLSKQFMG